VLFEVSADGWGGTVLFEVSADGWGGTVLFEVSVDGWGGTVLFEVSTDGWGGTVLFEVSADGWGGTVLFGGSLFPISLAFNFSIRLLFNRCRFSVFAAYFCNCACCCFISSIISGIFSVLGGCPSC
jgi:hypothetical protein